MERHERSDGEAPAEPALLDLGLAGTELRGSAHADGRRATTLVHGHGLNVVLMHLVAGARLSEHSAPAGLTVQVWEGRVRVTVGDQQLEATGGQLVAVEGAVRHSIEAIEDTMLLLTIAAPGLGTPG